MLREIKVEQVLLILDRVNMLVILHIDLNTIPLFGIIVLIFNKVDLFIDEILHDLWSRRPQWVRGCPNNSSPVSRGRNTDRGAQFSEEVPRNGGKLIEISSQELS